MQGLERLESETRQSSSLPLRLRMKSSSIIFRSGLMLGLYMSVLSRMIAKARMKMVSGLWNCWTTSGLHMQYLWLQWGGMNRHVLSWVFYCQIKDSSTPALWHLLPFNRTTSRRSTSLPCATSAFTSQGLMGSSITTTLCHLNSSHTAPWGPVPQKFCTGWWKGEARLQPHHSSSFSGA